MQFITAASFAEFIAKETRILVVTASWCGPSRQFMSVIEALERELDARNQMSLLDADAEPALTATL
jgi:thioredoxin-like negative regulator of GroEL